MKKKRFIEPQVDEKIVLDFCEEEVELYDNVISIIDFDVMDDETLMYNSLPLYVKKRKLVRLSENIVGYPKKTYMAFRPLKNHNHCQFLLEWIQENEHPGCKIIVVREIISDTKRYFHGYLKDGDNNTIEEFHKCRSEIEAKFCVLYKFFDIMDDNIIKNKVRKIRNFDREYKRNEEESKKPRRGRRKKTEDNL